MLLVVDVNVVFLKEEIEIIPAEEFGEFVPKAKQILEKHPKDFQIIKTFYLLPFAHHLLPPLF